MPAYIYIFIYKERYNNHTKSFTHEKYNKETELEKYVWELKDQHKVPTIKWKVLKKVNGKSSAKFCKLCSMEKLFIIKSLDDTNLLKKKSELVSKCRHLNKNLLSDSRE